MLSIIKSDLYRISKGKAIYIVILIILILNIVSAVGLDAGHIGLSVGTNIDVTDTETLAQISSVNSISDYRKLMKSFGTFPLDKDVIGQNVNLYYLFIVIVVIILCTDFSNKSIKNTLSSAISKRKYYLSKLFLILGLSTIIVLFNNYSFYLINLIINGKAFTSSLINLFHIKADWFFNYEFQYALVNLVNNPTTSYIIKCTLLGIFYIIFFNIIGYYLFKKTDIN